MKVKDLKKIINDLPDDAIVVTAGNDHDYRVCSCATQLTALLENRHLYEYYDGDVGKQVNVLLIE